MKRGLMLLGLAAAVACGSTENGEPRLDGGQGGSPSGTGGSAGNSGLLVLSVEQSIELCRDWCLCESPGASDLTRCEEDCKNSLATTCELLHRSPGYQCAIDVACDDPFNDCAAGREDAVQQCSAGTGEAYEPVARCTFDNCDRENSSLEEYEDCRASCGHCTFLCDHLSVDFVQDVDQIAQRNCLHQCEVELINAATTSE